MDPAERLTALIRFIEDQQIDETFLREWRKALQHHLQEGDRPMADAYQKLILGAKRKQCPVKPPPTSNEILEAMAILKIRKL